jgi:hypothetical protein
MVAVPVAEPETTPVVLTGATLVLLLLQVLPTGLDPSVVLLPTHNNRLPVTTAGVARTANDLVRRQPVDKV